MEYLLLIYGDAGRSRGSAAQRADVAREYVELADAMGDAGVYVSGGPLTSTGQSTTVRLRGAGVIVSDGPSSDARSPLDGYFLVDVDSAAEARAWAARVPAARWGSVEVRPLLDVESEARAA